MRIQIELDERTASQMKTRMEELGVETYKDLFNNAIALLNWAVEERRQGRNIVAIDRGTGAERHLVMPILETAAMKLSG